MPRQAPRATAGTAAGAAPGAEPDAEPVARSAITPVPPVTRIAGWEVSGRVSDAPLTITDETPLAKIQVKAPWDGDMAAALGVPHGRAADDGDGALVTGAGPGEWLVLAAPGTAAEVAERLRRTARESAPGELVTVIDLTHGRALLRLAGDRCTDLLAKVCAIDFSDDVTPEGAAFRTSVAQLATDVVRDSRAGRRSYLLHCERSSGQYLFDALWEAGSEFGIEVEGFRGLDGVQTSPV